MTKDTTHSMGHTAEANAGVQGGDVPPISRRKKILQNSAWAGFTILCLVVFTFLNLPQTRIKNYINGTVNSILGQRGISYSAKETRLSFLWGLSYILKDVTLNFPPPSESTHVDRIEVSPSLLSLFIGKFGGNVRIENEGGALSSSFSMRNTQMSVSFQSKKLDLGKLGLLPIAAGVQGSAILDGNGSISGDFAVPSTLEGVFEIHLSKATISPQMIAGFTIPEIKISEAVADGSLGQGKLNIKTFRLGKSGNAVEDIQGTITGDLALGKRWDSSILNLKTRFSLSPNILKSFVLLDAILGAGKQADGSYAFTLTGPIGSPNPLPGA